MSTGRVWPTVALEEICTPEPYAIAGGPFGSDLTRADYVESPGVPVIRGTNLGGDTGLFVDDGFVYVTDQKAVTLERNLARPGDLVFTQRGTLGQVAIIPTAARFPKYVVSQSQMKVSVDPTRADAAFVWHSFRSPDAQRQLLRQTLATGVPHINLGILRRQTLPLPPLPEQRRIAALLDKADAIRRKRQQAARLVDDLVQSLYLALVGPGSREYDQWPILRIEFVEEGIAVLGIDNAVQNRFAWAERRFITREKYAAMARYTVKPGDVIITIMGTTGRSAVVPDGVPVAISTKHLATITVDRTRVHPEFLSNAIHRDPQVASQLQARNRGAIMSGLNLGLIRSLELRLPPIAAQARFAAAVGSIRRLEARRQSCSNQADYLFHSLVQRAFGGRAAAIARVD